MTMTRKPSDAAYTAVASPAGPAPTTSTSKRSSCAMLSTMPRQRASACPASPSGAKPTAVRLDVTDTDEVESVMKSIADEYGRIDILANNAGVAQPIADVVDTPDTVFDQVFAVNVRGVLACSRAAAQVMKRHEWGRIINTASQTGKVAWPGWASTQRRSSRSSA